MDLSEKDLTWNSDYNTGSFELVANHHKIATYVFDPRLLGKRHFFKPVIVWKLYPELIIDNKKYYPRRAGFFRKKLFLYDNRELTSKFLVRLDYDLLWRGKTFTFNDGSKYYWKHPFLSVIAGGNQSVVTDSRGKELMKISLNFKTKKIELDSSILGDKEEQMALLVLVCWISLCEEDYGYHNII